jgi:hypothetical protein
MALSPADSLILLRRKHKALNVSHASNAALLAECREVLGSLVSDVSSANLPKQTADGFTAKARALIARLDAASKGGA